MPAHRSNFLAHGYAVVNLPPSSPEVLESFDRMPQGGHSPRRLRETRRSQYRGRREAGQWIFGLLPRREDAQPAESMHMAEADGAMPLREPVECDPSPLMAAVLEALPTDPQAHYHVNVNQIRVTANALLPGVTMPEGPRRDGHEFSVICIAARHNVLGGETQIIDPVSHEIVHRQLLAPNQAVLIDDERFIHNATGIVPAEGRSGHRDTWVIEVNRWERRAGGPLHEIYHEGRFP